MIRLRGIPFVDSADIGFWVAGDTACSLDQVKSNLQQYTNIKYYKGIFPQDTANQIEDCKFALVNIDVDIQQSISDCLEYFYPRLVKDGYILIHDYDVEPVRAVVDKFIVDRFMADDDIHCNLVSTQFVIKKR